MKAADVVLFTDACGPFTLQDLIDAIPPEVTNGGWRQKFVEAYLRGLARKEGR